MQGTQHYVLLNTSQWKSKNHRDLFHVNLTQQGFITAEQMKPQDFNL